MKSLNVLEGEATELAYGKNTLDNDQYETVERAAKRQTMREQQSQYNEEMVKHTRQPRRHLKRSMTWFESK